MLQGEIGLQGHLTMKVIKRARPTPPRARRWAILKWRIRHFFTQRWREWPLEAWLALCKAATWMVPGANVPMHGRLWAKVLRQLPDGTEEVWDYGHIGCHLITTAGKKYVASTFANTAEPEVFKFHGYGTGTTAAAVGDTALGTELTTQYATDNTRPTGTQSSDGTVTTYTTVATLSPDSGGTIAVTEWGLLSQAANSGGTLLDRQVFSAVNLVAGSDSLQTTYVLTIA